MVRVIEDLKGIADLIYLAENEAPGALETDLMAKAIMGVEGMEVQ